VTAGIYVIRNQVNGKEYVGKAVRVNKRWRDHQCDLRAGRHPNPLLQRAWDKYGESSFQFELIEVVTDLGTLAERENHHADIRKPAYNISPMGTDRRKIRGLEYSEETARRVEAVFREMQQIGVSISGADIAQRLGLSRRTVDYVLHDAEWWTGEIGQAAAIAALTRGHHTMAAAGHPDLRKAMETHAATGYAAIRRAQTIAVAAGTGPKKGRDRQAADGYLGLKKGLETLASLGYPNLSKAVHAVVTKRRKTQARVFGLLQAWMEKGCSSPFTATAVARELEMQLSTACLHLQRLRNEGLIDKQNRPIQRQFDS
jgi:DNA-binding transcriptional ArsR family regulator